MMHPSSPDPRDDDPENDNAGKSETTTTTRKERLKARLGKVGKTLQKINLVKLIGDMEQDQELADDLEVVNVEIKEECERKELVREATDACKAEIENHLDEFLKEHPDAVYEEWIQDVHPDNVSDGTLLSDFKQVDMRFFVIDSDHRLMWNQRAPEERQVPARTYQQKDPGTEVVDLLS